MRRMIAIVALLLAGGIAVAAAHEGIRRPPSGSTAVEAGHRPSTALNSASPERPRMSGTPEARVASQIFRSAEPPAAAQEEDGPPYNGRFTFLRIRYGSSSDLRSWGGRRRGWGRGRSAPWAHDYPRAETNFAKIVSATTFIDTYTEGRSGRVLTLDDPELLRYPVASIIEVGYWYPSEEEVIGLRNYLLKGGFLIVDDTRDERGHELPNFRYQMSRVLPDHMILPMPTDHEIFNSFFRIEDPLALVPPYGWYSASYAGIFENNDPENGRVMVMINWNQDLQEYWEYSDLGYYPIDLSNEAYKFGVNYLIYAFTH